MRKRWFGMRPLRCALGGIAGLLFLGLLATPFLAAGSASEMSTAEQHRVTGGAWILGHQCRNDAGSECNGTERLCAEGSAYCEEQQRPLADCGDQVDSFTKATRCVPPKGAPTSDSCSDDGTESKEKIECYSQWDCWCSFNVGTKKYFCDKFGFGGSVEKYKCKMKENTP